MNNLAKILMFSLLLVSACRNKDDCEKKTNPNCPLTTGEYCINGHINVNDSCVCPEGTFDFGASCQQIYSGAYYFDINCFGFEGFRASFTPEFGNLIYAYSTEDLYQSVISGYLGDSSDFTMMLDFYCKLPNGINAKPWLVGGVSNDTMQFEIEWHFFYWEDSLGTFYSKEPELGEYTPPLFYLDSIAEFDCGSFMAVKEE